MLLIGRPPADEREELWGTGRFPTLSERRGRQGETWFPSACFWPTRAVRRAFSSREQVGHAAGAEPAGGVAVGPPALAAKEKAAQPEREPQKAPRTLRAPLTAMLRQEAEVAAQVLAEEPPRMRGAAHVHALRSGEEDDLPAGLPEPVAPVRLLAEEEEVLVGRTDGLDRRAAHQHAGTHDALHLAHLVVVESARVERVDRSRAWRELAQEEVLGREPPRRREAANRALQGAVRIRQARPDDRRLRPRVGELDEAGEGVADEPGVRVQQQDVTALGLLDPAG